MHREIASVNITCEAVLMCCVTSLKLKHFDVSKNTKLLRFYNQYRRNFPMEEECIVHSSDMHHFYKPNDLSKETKKK